MAGFKRHIDDKFLDALVIEATKIGWWRDVLDDPGLFVAMRGSSLNVYFRGQSLFLVKNSVSGLIVTTHEKYLIDPNLNSQVNLNNDGNFDIARLIECGFIRQYKGKYTLAKMKSAASYYSGQEKRGCHEIAIKNSSVIDCEIAFPDFVSPENGAKNEKGRVDIACLEERDDRVCLVFWEAKHFDNKELRADLRPGGKEPPVCEQIEKYQKYLSAHSEQVVDSYTQVATNLVAINKQMGAVRKLSPLIDAVGRGDRRLLLDKEPQVGLIIFGFDQAQRDDKNWKKHEDRLNKKISRVVKAGSPQSIKL